MVLQNIPAFQLFPLQVIVASLFLMEIFGLELVVSLSRKDPFFVFLNGRSALAAVVLAWSNDHFFRTGVLRPDLPRWPQSANEKPKIVKSGLRSGACLFTEHLSLAFDCVCGSSLGKVSLRTYYLPHAFVFRLPLFFDGL